MRLAAGLPPSGSAPRMRLCMVVHAYYPLAETRVEREAAAARDEGFEVTILALRGPGETAHEEFDGTHIRRLPLAHRQGATFGRIVFEYLGFFMLASLWLAVRTLRRPFNIVHFHNPPDFLVAAGLLPRIRGA